MTVNSVAVRTTLVLVLSTIALACRQPPPEDPAALRAIIADIETGWETADGTPFREHYLDFPGARYVESGGQNEGLQDLIENHVEPEGDVLDSLALELTNIETNFEGAFAWAIADVEVKATIKADGRQIHRRGYETFLFRLVDGVWKVVHTHSSTRPVSE
jgi:Domain of unknown function (DUF4440)